MILVLVHDILNERTTMLPTNYTDYTAMAGTHASAHNAVNTAVNQLYYNVMTYGAKGDGSTDDSVAFNTAINAANTAGGGTVWVPPTLNNYSIFSGILMQSNVVLRGAGDGSHIKLANSSGVNVITNANQASGNSNMAIMDLLIDGNGNNQPIAPNSSGTGVDTVYFIYSTNILIQNCHIINGNRHNLFFSTNCEYIRVLGNRLENALGLSNCSTFTITDMVFANNVSSGAAQTGIKTDTSQTVTIANNILINNTTHQAFVTNGTSTTITGNSCRGGQTGIRVTSNDYTVISSNSLRSHSQNGIVFLQNCNYESVVGNLIRDVGSSAANTYDGINITDTGTGCTDIEITGNTIIDTQSNMRYGVYAPANGDYILVNANTIKGFQTAAYSLTGANSNAFNNSGASDRSATSSLLGLMQLTGDLGNTAASPQVVSTHLSAALPVAQGGTGHTGLTSHTVLIGGSSINNSGAGTAGQILISGGASADPHWHTATSQVLGFYGVTGVVQPTTTGTTTGYGAGVSTAVTIDGTFTGNTGSTAYTIGDVVNALKKLGLMAA